MRQAGVIAAAGIVGLSEHVPKLAADHTRAKSLARGLAFLPGVLRPVNAQTNIVFFDLDHRIIQTKHFFAKHPSGGGVVSEADETFDIPPGTVTLNMDSSVAFASLIRALGGIKIGAYGHGRLRAVTHHQITDDDIDVFLRVSGVAIKLMS